MASIHKEILIEARPEDVWEAIRDVGAIHRRLAPGFVVDTQARRRRPHRDLRQRHGRARADRRHRRAITAAWSWSVVGGRMTHHNASLQVFADGESRSRVVWIADLLPNDLAGDRRRDDRAGHGRHAADAASGSRARTGWIAPAKQSKVGRPESVSAKPMRPPSKTALFEAAQSLECSGRQDDCG